MSLIVFIPSKDRPQQLRLLLKSICLNLPAEEMHHIKVFYKATSDSYRQGYTKVMKEFENSIPYVEFFDEDTFKGGTKESIEWFTQICMSKYILLLTDDSLVYRYIRTLKSPISLLDEHKNILTFSLRLGHNTNIVDYTNYNRPESDVDSLLQAHKCYDKDIRSHAEGVYTWNWKTTRIAHFSHPISLDGTIIRTEDLKMLTRDAEHGSYRQWECCLSDYVRRFDKNLHGCFYDSHVVTIPVNQVVAADKLTDGVHFPRSPEELNKDFLAGKVIDIHTLMREAEYYVDTPLKEFPFVLRKQRWYDRFIGY